MTEWHPISMVKKDGKKVVLWIGGDSAPVCSWDLMEGGDEDGTGWIYAWFRHDTEEWIFEDDIQPTAWMPVPE